MLQVPDKMTKALLDFAEFMEGVPAKQYRQEIFQDDCGGGCLAYWACRKHSNDETPHMETAAELLGLKDRELAAKVFHSDGGQQHNYLTLGLLATRGPTPQEAASMLRTLAVTGELISEWTRYIKE